MIATSTATATVPTASRRTAGTMSRALIAVALVVEVALGAGAVIALGVIGAADAAGVELVAPEPGPVPQPRVAPPGLDR